VRFRYRLVAAVGTIVPACADRGLLDLDLSVVTPKNFAHWENPQPVVTPMVCFS
jgi:hypothetical protein